MTISFAEARERFDQWLRAVAQDGEVSIHFGEDSIELRKPAEPRALEEEPYADQDPYQYAWEEYGATREEVDRFQAALDKRARQLDEENSWLTFNSIDELKAAVEAARLEEEAGR